MQSLPCAPLNHIERAQKPQSTSEIHLSEPEYFVLLIQRILCVIVRRTAHAHYTGGGEFGVQNSLVYPDPPIFIHTFYLVHSVC